jgi:signal transduction histidine kinase
MTASSAQQMELNIARYRLVLSPAGVVAVFVDPAEPLLSRWIPLSSGLFLVDRHFLFVMALHFTYSAFVYMLLRRDRVRPELVAAVTIWVDLFFGAAAGIFTEGSTSPAYPFFIFAVLAAGLRAGVRQALWVTAASVVLYEGLIVISAGGSAESYVMRPVYLAIIGYLVGSLGQQRLDLEDEISQFKVNEQRHRIARDLHDNFTQALAAISLRLESWRRQLDAGGGADLLPDLVDLQQSVKREAEQLRIYTRSLAGVVAQADTADSSNATRLRMVADLSGPLGLVDQVLQIVREGLTNVRRHAHAKTASIEIRGEPACLRVIIEDDGVGFRNDVPPWSIASRVRELRGHVEVMERAGCGARLVITVPQS